MVVHIVKDIDDATPASGSQAVDRALALLQITGHGSGQGVALSELISASGLGKPTVRRLMLALIRRGLVEQDGATRLYHLGEESYVLGTLATPRHGLLEAPLKHLETGAQHPLGIGAGSLAMLSALPDAEVEELLAANADRLAADYPNYDADLLRSDVAKTRARGFALNPGRIVAGSWGVGVALRRPDGSVVGAMSIAAIENRMQPPRDVELAALLASEARDIELRLARRMPQTALQENSR